MSARPFPLYQLIKPASLWREVPLLLGFNLLLVASAYLSFSVPFSPVPITGQTLGVMIIALALGRTRALAVTMAYLLEGIAGLPVFAGGAAGIGVLFGPTGGYLLGMVVAAGLVGHLADRGWDRKVLTAIGAVGIGHAVIFVVGLAQLSYFVPVAGLLAAGFWPFLPGTALKIVLAALLLPAIWRLTGRSGDDRPEGN